MDLNLQKKILSEIKPTSLEHKKRVIAVNDFIKLLENSVKKLGFDCDFFIGGSFGKGTYLNASSDVDIFARFDLSYDDFKLSDYLQEILENAKVDFKKQKGSRDYFSSVYKKEEVEIKFEIVPNRRIKTLSDSINSTDVSPRHVEFLKERMKTNKNLADEIRLAKQFFKAKGLYGAESYIGGFSGHIIDILVAYYGSLENLLLSAKDWGENTYIDIADFYSNYDDALLKISEDKVSDLVVVDPIIKERNAARALTKEKYSKFIVIASLFEKFNENDFRVLEIDLKGRILEHKKFAKNNNLDVLFYIFDFEISSQSEDIVGAKLLKLNQRLEKYFENLDFKVFKNDFLIDMKNENRCFFAYFFEKTSLSNIKKVIGPKVFMKDALINFLEKRDNYFILDLRICSYDKRKITKLEQIYDFKIEDLQKLLGKNISFVKKLKILK